MENIADNLLGKAESFLAEDCLKDEMTWWEGGLARECEI